MFNDGYFHFAKSFLNSLKTNYPNHPKLLINYEGDNQNILSFLDKLGNIEIITFGDQFPYDGGEHSDSFIYNSLHLWTDRFSEYDSILYLDVDMIVLRPLDYLFDHEDFYIISDHNPHGPLFFQEQYDNNEDLRNNLKEDGFSDIFDIDYMPNTGVFLLPKKYRTESNFQELIEFGKRYGNYLNYYSQSIITLWIKKHNIAIDKNYDFNCQVRFLFHSDLKLNIYDIAILHYSGENKPGSRWDNETLTSSAIFISSNDLRVHYRKRRNSREKALPLLNTLHGYYQRVLEYYANNP